MNLSKVITALLLIVAMMHSARCAKLCDLKESEYPKVVRYSGSLLESYDENYAGLPDQCTELWCKEMCRQNSKCKKWSVTNISGKGTTCTLHGSGASLKAVKCLNAKCNSQYGKCAGSF